ncbi:ABC transporter ATP-binding protein [Kribbella sp.]|uniref:ABC transporter ATP-binding protein n=1 Tax=Kribbella sp. TaxID=1871183 RepID=UPI002D6446E7|nr:ABC transporter ATP-binding protein [Kribbella sp.]HZX04466.1 ABC transporter ATP-binding protein [Kribbella sp.]
MRFAQVAWRAGPGLFGLTVVSVVLSAAAPVGAVVGIGQVVAGVVRGESGRAVVWAVVAGGCLLLQWLAGALQRASAVALGERVDAELQHELMAAVSAPGGVRRLEDPATAQLVEVGRDTLRADWARPGRLAGTLGGLVTGRVVLVASGVILGGFHWWLGAGLLVAGVWAAYEDKVASRSEAGHHYGATESARRMRYFNDLGTTPPAAKEIRLFGLPEYVVARHGETWTQTMRHVLHRPGRRPLLATAVLGAVVLSGIVLVIRAATTGHLSAGATATYLQTYLIALAGIQQSSWTGLQTELALTTLHRYNQALQAITTPHPTRGTTAPERGSQAAGGVPVRAIAFRGVGFAYPGSDREVLRDLELVIPAGESLAIVGANGAGKTSLVKLLCGLYEPTRGTITVDGTDLQDLDIEGWRRRLAVVFQQPLRLPMSAYDNVRFGRAEAAAEVAVERAGAASIVEGLPDGWDTILSSEFDGGVELSGGEWQRLGLARALYAVQQGASVLILDEPAAHLDARSEAELYRRFLELTTGLSTILISHRFSTVRQASSIVVLDEGRVIEQGSHDELLDLDGSYASMFRLQAARFGEPA